MRLASSATLVLVVLLVSRTSETRQPLLHRLLQRATQSVHELVPSGKNPGWQEEMSRNVETLIWKLRQEFGLADSQRPRRQVRQEEELGLTRDHAGVFILQGIEHKYSSNARYPTDINIFSMKNNDGQTEWYAVTLQAPKSPSDLADTMVIYKYSIPDSKFVSEVSMPVLGAVDVETFEIGASLYLVVAEHTAGGNPLEGSTIYNILLDNNGKLKLESVQTLNTKYPRDITVWTNMNQVFLAVAQSSDVNNTESSGDTLVYRWLGQHFDLICNLQTYDARKVHYFKVGSSMFLAIANHQNIYKDSQVYSEIFKYNLNENKFISYQKIKTRGAMDIKVFCFQNKRKVERFMIIANMYIKDDDGNLDYQTESVIYKFVEGYFTPFQSITVPGVSQWEPVVGNNGEFVLLGASKLHGLQAVQYDGWRFIESNTKLIDEELEMELSKIRALNFIDKRVVVIASKKNDGSKADILELKFEHNNVLDKFHKSLERWCNNSLELLEQSEVATVVSDLEQAPKLDSPLVEITGNITFTSLTVGELVTSNLNTTNGTLNKNTIDTLNKLHTDIIDLTSKMERIINITQSSVKINEDIVVDGNLEFESVTLACLENCSFENVHIKTLNGESFDKFLDHTVDLRNDLSYGGALEFEHISIKDDITGVKAIDEVKIENLVDKSSDISLKHPLTIYGELHLDQGATVYGDIEGLGNIATLENGTLSVPSLKIKNIDADALNSIPLRRSRARQAEDYGQFKKANVNNLIVTGLISGIDFLKLAENSLKTSGNQTLSGSYSFESLVVEEDCKVEGLMSGLQIPDGLVLIHEGTMPVTELRFKSPLSAANMTVRRQLNEIPVDEEGHLRLLLQDSRYPQHVQGHKTVEDLVVTGHWSLEGSVNGAHHETSNKEVIVKDDVFVDGDLNLRGHIVVDGKFYAEDLLGDHFSMNRLLSYGLRLDETNIYSPLTFKYSPVQMTSLTAKTINGLHPEDWLHQSSTDESLQIYGEKSFTGNLHFHQPFIVDGLINEVDVRDLDVDVLRTSGDQIINGHKTFSMVSAESAMAEKAWIGHIDWENILLSDGDQNITGLKTISESVLISETFDVVELEVHGTLCSINLEDLMSDSLFIEETSSKSSPVIRGTKQFVQALEAEDVTVLHDTDVKEALDHKTNIFYVGDITFKNPAKIEKLTYQGLLDSVSDNVFGEAWLLSDAAQSLKGNQIISEIEAYGGTYTTSGLVNDISFTTLARDAIYIDKNANLESANFERGVFVQSPLKLDGKLQDVDITKELVLRGEEAVLLGTKIFTGLVVMSNLTTKQKLAGLDLDHLCDLAFAENPGSLVVKGSVNVTHEPHVTELINNYEVQGMQENLWYTDKDSVLTRFVTIKEITLEDEVKVQGLVDGVNLEKLESHYFSKSKDQHVKAAMTFKDSVGFKNDVYSLRAYVGGLVGNLNLQYFDQQVLKDGPDQDIVEYLIFNKIHTKGDIPLRGPLNKLDLARDVMLLSREHNKVTAKKVVQGLNARDVRLADGATVQGVDVQRWVKQAVRTSGNFGIKGVKSFVGSHFNTIEVDNLVDKRPFSTENIMVQGREQVVTGQKIFVTGDRDAAALTITYLNIDGLINDLDFSEICSKIAYKDSDIIIFNAYKNLTAPISMDYGYVEGLYQGVNISSLHPQLMAPEYLKGLEGTFYHLMEAARVAEHSLAAQAVYLSHYRAVQTIKSPVEAMFPVYVSDSQVLLAVVKPASETDVVVDMLQWSDKSKKFLPSDAYKSRVITRPHYIYEEKDNNYVMTCNYETLNNLLPEYYPRQDNDVLGQSDLKANQKVLSINLREQHCILSFSPYVNASVKVYCEQNKGQKSMALYQDLYASNPIQATSTQVEGVPYLMVVQGAQPGRESSVEVWHLKGEKLAPRQTLDVVNAVAVTATSHRGQHFLAVASGLVQQAAHQGTVYLLRLEESSGLFRPWLELDVIAPVALHFATLPSRELVLYVLTENQASPLSVFLYRGEEGFREKSHASTVAVANSLNAFSVGPRHFVTLAGGFEGRVLEAVLKGNLN